MFLNVKKSLNLHFIFQKFGHNLRFFHLENVEILIKLLDTISKKFFNDTEKCIQKVKLIILCDPTNDLPPFYHIRNKNL